MWKVLAATCLGAGGSFAWYVKQCKAAKGDDDVRLHGSLQERFRKFASIGKHDFMTVEDFVASCCGGSSVGSSTSSSSSSSSSAMCVSPSMKELFDKTDADGDGVVSFSEYCLLFSLISVKDDMFRTAFHMFDRDESGKLDFAEFKSAMEALCVDPSAKLELESSGLIQSMFGKKLDKTLTLKDFLATVQKLRWEVRAVEFQQHEHPKSTKSPPTGKVALGNLRRILGVEATTADGSRDDEMPVSWLTYTKLFDVIRESESVERALTLLVDAKKSEQAKEQGSEGKSDEKEASIGATKAEFARALAAAKLKLSPEDIDVFYRLFDADGSGSLDPEEFGNVCRLRGSFYASYVPRFNEPQRNPVQQFVYCMQQRT